MPSARSADTCPEAESLLLARWKHATLADRAAMVRALCGLVERFARAGIAAQHPDFTEIEVVHELARRRYGAELADAAYAGRLPAR